MFTAGVDVFGFVNFESFFRQTEPWMAAISKTEYGDPVTEAAVLRSLSPIHKLDRITAPLFADEGHGRRKTPDRVRSTTEIVAFFVEHLKR